MDINEVIAENIKAIKTEIAFPSGDYSDPVDSFWQNAYDTVRNQEGFDQIAFDTAWDQAIRKADLADY